MSKSIISNAVFILCILLCFVFTLVSYIQLSSSDYVYISSIGRNWGSGPISEAEASGYDCSAGKIPVMNDFWDGTVNGCACPALITDGLSRGSCSRKSYACSNVYAISPMPFRLWKSTNICGKRGPTYLDLKTAKTESECGSGYKSCGIIDTLNQVLCYPSNVDCPYNYVRTLGPNEAVPSDMKYDVVPLGFNGQEGKLIFSNENKNGKIINQFRVDDDIPCISPDYKHLSVTPYYLEKSWDKNKCTNDVSGQFFDSSYVKIDSESYNRLYSDNQILGILMSLPQFQKYNYLNAQTSLFYKNYIGMDRKCVSKLLGGLPSQQVIEDLAKIETSIGSASTCALVGLIFSIIGIIVLGIMLCVSGCGNSDGWIVFNVIGGIFFTLPAIIISSILVSKSGSINYDMGIFADPNCTDQITSNAVLFFTSKISSGVSMAIAYLVCAIIAVVCNIAAFFVRD